MKCNPTPTLINVDKAPANKAAVNTHNKARKKTIKVRQNKYLNNIVEQDHRGPKRIIKPMLGFKSFKSAQHTIAGIELARMLHKGQACPEFAKNLTPAEQFYKLAA